jgi:TonB family protein
MSSELTSRNSGFSNRMRMEPCISRSDWQLPRGNFPALGGALLLTLLLAASPACRGENTPPHVSTERSGTIPTSEGLTLHMTTDLGSVNIQRQPPGAARTVQYSVHIETDAREPLAAKLLQNYTLAAASNPSGVTLTGAIPPQHTRARGRQQQAQFWVRFLISVPGDYNVEVSTGAGDIEASDLGGHVVLETDGGNITTGRIGFDRPAAMIGHPMAKIETQGGHISVEDVFGDFDAYTAGGHIRAGNIAGNAKLRTGGGHIRAGKIQGVAQLETEGGNITVGEAGALVTARTGGGQIDFGEVHGSVNAQNGGGGIRMMYVAGPLEVVTSGGSICLTKVTNTVRAATGDGTITAWIAPDSDDPRQPVRLPGPSQLASGTGDIVLYLPRNIAATIDATVDRGGANRIEADPSLRLKPRARPDGVVRAMGNLNGGGAVLKLHTATGKIRLQYLDADSTLRNSLLQEQKHRIEEKLQQAGFTAVTIPSQAAEAPPAISAGGKGDWFDTVITRLEIGLTGGLHEDQDEFMKHVLNQPPPEYPQLARKAGVQGVVRLQVRLKTDGTLVVEKVLEGEPALVDAATAAVKQWRLNPEEWGGKKVDVISTVTFNFQLR